MFISPKLVRKYKQTHERKFGQSISAKEAERKLSDLAELIKLLSKERSHRYGK